MASAKVQPLGPIQFWLRRNSPGVLTLSPPRRSLQQNFVEFLDQASGYGQFSKPTESVFERPDVVGYLADTGHRIVLVRLLKERQLLYVCVGVLDPGTEDRLAPQVGPNEQVGIGEELSGPGEFSQGLIDLAYEANQLPVQREVRGKRPRSIGEVAFQGLSATAGAVRTKLVRMHCLVVKFA